MGLPVSGPSVCRALCTCVVFVSSPAQLFATCPLDFFHLFLFVSHLSPSCLPIVFFHLFSPCLPVVSSCFFICLPYFLAGLAFVLQLSPTFPSAQMDLSSALPTLSICACHLSPRVFYVCPTSCIFPTCLLYHFPVLTAGKCSEHVSCQCHGIFVFVHEIKRFSVHL